MGTATGAPSGEPLEPDEEVRILLFMQPGRDRDLVADALGERYQIETGVEPSAVESAFDCCIFDTETFVRVAEAIEARRERASPAFLPFVLLASGDTARETTEAAWDRVDDIIELPVRRRALRTRIGNLI
ncbi:hypothetical protein DJ71_23620, partial [Halorubrum sp. E3]